MGEYITIWENLLQYSTSQYKKWYCVKNVFRKIISAIKFAENVVRCKFISKLDIFSLISLTDNNLVTLILQNIGQCEVTL